MSALPDMYGHIRQRTIACVATNMLHSSGTLKICSNLLLTALVIYIAKDSHCDYGILILTFQRHLFIQYIQLWKFIKC